MTGTTYISEHQGFNHYYADVNGVRLHYVSVGNGDMILFLHGFPDFWAMWEHQLVEFGRDRQAVAMDLRGFNLSSKPDDLELYGLQHIVADVKAMVEHLGHARCVLVAHDWGGAAAWLFARAYPDLVEKLVIINSPHPVMFAREMLNNPAQRAASQYMLYLRRPGADTLLKDSNYALLFQLVAESKSTWTPSPEDLRRYRESWSLPGGLTGGLNYYRASFIYPPSSPEEEDRLRTFSNLKPEAFMITVPTLVIWGERDPAFVNENLVGLEKYVPDLRVVRISDATHWVVREQPRRINALIREFISTSPATGS